MAGPWDPGDQNGRREVRDEELVRPVGRGHPAHRSSGRGPERRRTREPPRRPRPQPSVPLIPTVVVALVVVVGAFALGRVTAGGGDDDASVTAASSPSTTTSTTAPVLTHTVKEGESLLGIASQYGVTADAIALVNGLSNQNHVFVGQVLEIPPSSFRTETTTTTRR